MKALVMLILASGCIQSSARVEVEDYESRVERIAPALLAPDSGRVAYIGVRRKDQALVERYDARLRRDGDALVLAGYDGDNLVRVMVGEVQDVELVQGRVVASDTSALSTDALSIGLVTAVLVGLLAIIVVDQ